MDRLRRAGCVCLAGAGVAASVAFAPDAESASAGALAAICLALWLTEVVPAFVPTLVLLGGTPLVLGHFGPAYAPRAVLAWAADPVLALFFGGFVLGEAARVHGIDRSLSDLAIRAARGRSRALVALVGLATAALSMWMSNIAAAALMIASVEPLSAAEPRLRRALLVAVAIGADLGGMATPIGTGANGIAIAAMPADQPVTFLTWMAFAVPLTTLALSAALALVVVIHRVGGRVVEAGAGPPRGAGRPGAVGALACVAILAWLTEPWHGVASANVSLALATVLFATGLVPADRIRSLDWATLVLIAGGITLGRLVETSGLLDAFASQLTGIGAPRMVVTAMLLATSALLSSVMSNTGTVTLLVPIAAAVEPGSHALPILVALAASFGMPFVVSTPPNAMAVGAGARASDLLVPGLLLMAGGVIALTLTGPFVLGLFGHG